ncbi:MAG: hypothetical protein H6826_13800, partial [Planctomycetes bacterium]|nr:hypothetical protein [Planctomycetota bacterium]
MLDLSAPAPAQLHSIPQPLVLKDGRGDPLGGADAPVTLQVVGCYSDQYVTAQRGLAIQAILRSTKAREDVLDRLKRHDAGLDVVVACVIDWSNVSAGGAPAACTPENVRTLLKGYPYARDQLEAFIHADRNFTKG